MTTPERTSQPWRSGTNSNPPDAGGAHFAVSPDVVRRTLDAKALPELATVYRRGLWFILGTYTFYIAQDLTAPSTPRLASAST